MQGYQHQISGIFQRLPDALLALAKLKANGMPASQMRIFPSHTHYPANAKANNSHHVLNNMFVYGAIGAMLGLTLGALVEWWLLLPNYNLLRANFIITTIAILGSSASVGATLGVIVGIMSKISNPQANITQSQGWLLSWAHRLSANKQMQLSVNTYSLAETAMVAGVMQSAVNNYQDIQLT